MILKYDLIGKKIIIKTLCKNDATPEYLKWLNDKEINAYLEVRRNPPKSSKELSDFIATCIDSNDDLLVGIFAKDAKHIGNIKIAFNWVNLRCEIGIIIGDKSFWGRGIATEAINLIVDYLINNINLNKIIAGLYKENIGSQKAFEKSGFLLEGALKDYWYFDGKFHDQLFYSFNRNMQN